MALFDKRSPIEKLWDMFSELADDDKGKFRAMLEDIDKAEDEREIDKIEEEKAKNPETTDEKKEEVKEESEEIGKKVDEAKDFGGDNIDSDKSETSPAVEEEVEKGNNLEERGEDVFKGLDARLKAIEDIVMHTAQKTEKLEDAGISGYGRHKAESVNDDTRAEDVIKMLGGRA